MTLDRIFKGRMSRKNFLFAQTILIAATLLIIVFILGGNFTFQAILDKNKELVASLLILAPLGLAFQFICSFRRLHDINQSGLWALLLLGSLLFIPFIDMILLIYLSYKKGDEQADKCVVPDTRKLINSLLNK